MLSRSHQLVLILLLPACVWVFVSEARADALVVTKAMTASTVAEVFIRKDSIRVELEIGARDLDGFRNVLPDGLYERLGHSPEPLGERARRFFAHDWVIRLDGSEPLTAQIGKVIPRNRVRRDEITGEPLATGAGRDEPVVFVELEYPLATRPKTLSIKPPMQDDSSFVSANIGFVLYHLEIPVNDFRYLGAEEIVDLDWDDPWYSRFRNRNLWRQFDAPIAAFIYVEHFEVRREIIVRPKDLQYWIDLGLDGDAVIPIEAQDDLKQRAAEFLAARNPVVIDGEHPEPTLDRIHFIRRSLKKTGVIDPPEDLDLSSATLGVIFVYPRVGLPQEVTMTWDMFSPRIATIPAAATDEAGGLPYTLTPGDPVLRWRNYLTNPSSPAMTVITRPPPPQISIPLASVFLGGLCIWLMASVARRMKFSRPLLRRRFVVTIIAAAGAVFCLPYARVALPISFAGRPAIAPDEAKAVLSGLLNNIYRAFDRREEDVIYDRLAISISGDLLSDVYLQTRRGIELEGQGGARVKVDTVEVLESTSVDTTETGGFVHHCRWNVSGSVGHWGHVHRRTNQYEAILTVEPRDGAWKIAGIDLREQKRMTGPI